MKKSKLMMIGLATLLSGGLSAQDVKTFDVGIALPWSLNTLQNITNHSSVAGACVDFGYNGHVMDSAVPFRVSLGANIFPAGDPNSDGNKVRLDDYQLAGDLFINTGYKGLSIVTGVSVNKWRMKTTAPTVTTTETVKGMKIGGRIGLEYAINKSFSAHAMLQVVEMGVNGNASQNYNPSWLQVGAKFHF